MNFYNKKTQRIVTSIIVIFLVLCMLIPIILGQ